MPIDFAALHETLSDRFGADVLWHGEFRGQQMLHIQPAANVKLLQFLRDNPATKFEMLSDITCYDTLRLPPDMQADCPARFAVVYQLNSLAHTDRLRVKAFVPEDPCEIDSVTSLWAGANWGEREVYDMYGVVFRGHPDLKRILTPDSYEGHPLRKDYPLKGRGERDRFPKYTELKEANG